MKRVNNVDEYITHAPQAIQARLKEMRKTIRATTPKADERMSYGMPYYDYKGRLAYFGFFTHHIGLYIPGSVIKDHKKELSGYQTSTATIRFPHNKKLPIPLIKTLIKARMKMNDGVRKKI